MLTEGDMLARLQKAIDHGGNTHTLQDVVEALKTGDMQCFWSDEALVVTQICQYPQKRILAVVFAAGKLNAVLALQPQLKRFAKEQDCDGLLVIGRRGWEKVLPQEGWKRGSTVFEMKVV